MIQPDASGLYHPNNENEIIELIENAIQNKMQVRVRGAAQSVTNGVFADGFNSANGALGKNINIELDQLRSVSIDTGTMQVIVGGGCNLGFDPFDPSHTSEQSNANNLFYQLNAQGLAIPNVSNAIHQTVAGFISTGSSAGTMQHSFDECLLSIRIIDGTGKVNTFTKSGNLDDNFYGVAVSMGLLGIITEVTLQCVPAFNITGKQSTTLTTDCEYDFFGSGTSSKPSLETYITEAEFSRILWWPFKTLNRVISWKAKEMTAADYDSSTGTAENFKPNPYKPLFPSVLGTTLPTETIAATGFQLIATWPDWFYKILGNSPGEVTTSEKLLFDTVDKIFPYFYPMLTDFFFPVNTPQQPGQVFWDNWLGSLPMDKVEYGNDLFNLCYAEMWVPAAMATQLVNTLQKDYETKGYTATGFYTAEILAAKESNFWLSPAYGTNCIRINILYFQNSSVPPENYYSQFWNLLNENHIRFRPHWGKVLPPANSTTGPAYLQNNYPKWNNFMALREQMDPHQIFVTDYWRSHMNIQAT